MIDMVGYRGSSGPERAREVVEGLGEGKHTEVIDALVAAGRTYDGAIAAIVYMQSDGAPDVELNLGQRAQTVANEHTVTKGICSEGYKAERLAAPEAAREQVNADSNTLQYWNGKRKELGQLMRGAYKVTNATPQRAGLAIMRAMRSSYGE